MPHAYVEIVCAVCQKNIKYHCFSHDNDGYLEDFNCHHFKASVFKRTSAGLLLGFDQLAGIYVTITCINCGKVQNVSYEAKTFGKKDRDYKINCCNNTLDFHCKWAH